MCGLRRRLKLGKEMRHKEMGIFDSLIREEHSEDTAFEQRPWGRALSKEGTAHAKALS